MGLVARRVELLEEVAREVRRDGAEAVVVGADLGEPGEVKRAVEEVARAFGMVDLLVANAGVGIRSTAVGFSAADVDRMIRVNLSGAAHAIEAVLPGMLAAGRGRIVGISSLAAYRGLPGSAGYCATKAGLTALLESLRPELAPRGVGVTTVHPGFVETPMIAGADHSHPFVWDVDRAARRIVEGIARGKRKIDFPWQLVALLSAVRMLPDPIFDVLARKLVPPPSKR